MPPEQDRMNLRGLAHEQCARALEAIHLVGRNRIEIHAKPVHVEIDSSPRLHAIGMEGDAGLARGRGYVPNGLNRAGFVVCMHHGNQNRVGAQFALQIVGIDDACLADAEKRDLDPFAMQFLAGVQYRRVFNLGGDYVLPPRAARAHRTQNSEIIRLGATGCEHDFAWRRPQLFGHPAARPFQSLFRGLPEMVDTGRVTVHVTRGFRERFEDARIDRSGGVMVEVSRHVSLYFTVFDFREMAIITLLTDFGLRDHYVGAMKGVIARIAPHAGVVDISHEVEPFQIAQGGYLLSQAWRYFPEGTVHVAVVDPGVGGERRAIAAEAQGHRFVLPDNGLLSLAGVDRPVVREIRNEALMLHPISRTFHGRDIFAPVAAHLAAGVPFETVGPLVDDWLDDWVKWPSLGHRVLHIDRFGNVITSLRAPASLQVRGERIDLYAPSYSAAPAGKLFLIMGSGGYVEISEREASAAARIGCRVGDLITLDEKS
jgi:S-adenosylmethionine hydrolase